MSAAVEYVRVFKPNTSFRGTPHAYVSREAARDLVKSNLADWGSGAGAIRLKKVNLQLRGATCFMSAATIQNLVDRAANGSGLAAATIAGLQHPNSKAWRSAAGIIEKGLS